GKNMTRRYLVADLVLPIENFGNVHGVSGPNSLQAALTPTNSRPGAPTPVAGRNALPNGEPTGVPSGSMMSTSSNPLGNAETKESGWNKKSNNQTTEDTLISLIKSTVSPRSWADMGGPGTIDYFPMTMTLVVNQTPDIQEQIADLLQALRRLQDQEVAMEVRLISIADDFFE